MNYDVHTYMRKVHCTLCVLSRYFFALLGTRYSEGDGSSNEVQRTMLELINQLDGFDPRGNIKVLMATNRCVHVCVCWCVCDVSDVSEWSPFHSRPDTLDPALLRPGRMDRKVEFGLPDLEVCVRV